MCLKEDVNTKQDLQTWLQFVEEYNAITPFPPVHCLTNTYLNLLMDAILTGYGVVCGMHWIMGTFLQEMEPSLSMERIVSTDSCSVYFWETFSEKRGHFERDDKGV